MRTLAPILFGLLIASTAQATSHRTFVAAEGVDSGTCGPTTPCRTLSYALSQTNSGGEIIITSSGGYGDATGGLTINKSVSIIAQPGIFAALAPTSGNGVTIATAGIDVALKGLSINGRGGNNGVLMTAGNSLRIFDCFMSGFTSAYMAGISVDTAAKVLIENTNSSRNTLGILLDSGATAEISRVTTTHNTANGILLGGNSGNNLSATTSAVVSDSIASHNADYGMAVLGQNVTGPGANGSCSSCNRRLTIMNSRASNNGSIGFIAGGGLSAVLTVSGSTATGNSYGLFNSFSSTVRSAGNNVLTDNSSGPTGGTIITTGVLY